MDERTLTRQLRAQLPAEPVYRHRLTDVPGEVAARPDRGPVRAALLPLLTALLLLGAVAAAGAILLWILPQPREARTVEVITPSGQMRHSRAHHTATLLPDGRVLVTGGARYVGGSAGSANAFAEVWDPRTGQFHLAGQMLQARGAHTATLLTDGRVLVVGGYGGVDRGGQLTRATAEVWDPKTETFQVVGHLSVPRYEHVAVLLPDDRVLVMAGHAASDEDRSVTTAEVWDPRTGSFSTAGTMDLSPRWWSVGELRTTLLADGRLLVTGDHYAEAWDPASASFGPTGEVQPPRATQRLAALKDRDGYTETLLPDGSWLITGGEDSSASVCASSPRPDGSCFARLVAHAFLQTTELHRFVAPSPVP